MPLPDAGPFRTSRLLPLVAVALLAAAPTRAEDAAPAPVATPTPEATVAPEATPPGPAPIEVTSFVDTYYGYFFNKPTGNVPLRNFDTKHNTFSLGLVEVAAEQKVTTANRLGFRLDLQAGPHRGHRELLRARRPRVPEEHRAGLRELPASGASSRSTSASS